MICDYFVDGMILIANEMTFELAPQYPQRLPEPIRQRERLQEHGHRAQNDHPDNDEIHVVIPLQRPGAEVFVEDEGELVLEGGHLSFTINPGKA